MSDILPFPNAKEIVRHRIRIVEEMTDDAPDLGGHVFVTIGLGETNVTVLDDGGDRLRHWTAGFGWSFLFEVPFLDEKAHFYLEEQKVVERALSGEARIFGKTRDTQNWKASCSNRFREAIDEILRGTVESGAGYDRIVLVMPEWMQPIAESVKGLRLNLESNIEIEEI